MALFGMGDIDSRTRRTGNGGRGLHRGPFLTMLSPLHPNHFFLFLFRSMEVALSPYSFIPSEDVHAA